MAISISDYHAHLQDDLKLNREYLKSQGSQNEGQKVFDRDSLESWNIKRSQGRKRAIWLFGCCECLRVGLCKDVF